MTAIGFVFALIGWLVSDIWGGKYELTRTDYVGLTGLFVGGALLIAGIALNLWEVMP